MFRLPRCFSSEHSLEKLTFRVPMMTASVLPVTSLTEPPMASTARFTSPWLMRNCPVTATFFPRRGLSPPMSSLAISTLSVPSLGIVSPLSHTSTTCGCAPGHVDAISANRSGLLPSSSTSVPAFCFSMCAWNSPGCSTRRPFIILRISSLDSGTPVQSGCCPLAAAMTISAHITASAHASW